MDFTKFMALLETQSLYFCRADLLSDPWEGALSRPTSEMIRLVEGGNAIAQGEYDPHAEFRREMRKLVYVSCWHENPHESAAMWRLYLKSDEGIAVSTTFERFVHSLDSLDTETPVNVGRVEYLDYDNAVIPPGNIFFPFLSKRISFAHEREVRAIVAKFPQQPVNTIKDWKPGVSVRVELNALIEKIVLAPFSPGWINELMKGVAERYRLTAPVRQSRIGEDPIY